MALRKVIVVKKQNRPFRRYEDGSVSGYPFPTLANAANDNKLFRPVKPKKSAY